MALPVLVYVAFPETPKDARSFTRAGLTIPSRPCARPPTSVVIFHAWLLFSPLLRHFSSL